MRCVSIAAAAIGVATFTVGCSFQFDPMGTLSDSRRMRTGAPVEKSDYRAPHRGYGGDYQRSYAGGATRPDTIVVQRGDTLYTIAQQHGVSQGHLMRINGMSGSDIYPGQRLMVR